MKEDVLEIATDRFERRLTEEIGAVRLEIAALRVEITAEIAANRKENAAGRLSLIALNVWVVLTLSRCLLT
jgi:hypothetical protein